MQYIQQVASVGVRPCGSAEEARAAQIVAQNLEEIGCKPTIKEFKFSQFTPWLPSDVPRDVMEGFWDQMFVKNWATGGTQVVYCGNFADPRYILVAHHDSALATLDGSTPGSPGGNDNASGVGTLLAVTKAAVQHGWDKDNLFVWVGCEEPGFFGSWWLAQQVSPAVGMVAVDQVAYSGGSKTLWVAATTEKLAQLIKNAAPLDDVRVDIDTHLPSADDLGYSDYFSWQIKGDPSGTMGWYDVSSPTPCSIEDPVYHTSKDDFAHIAGMEESVNVFGQWLIRILETTQ